MKRFYKDVGVAPGDGQFAVTLDGRPVLTPGRAAMLAPNEALAQMVATEWAAQGERIVPETMPFTQLLTTTIDRAPQRAEITGNAMPYLNSDLLCYRAPTGDEAAEQARLRDPWLAWFAAQSGVQLLVTEKLVRLDQPEAAHAYLRCTVDALGLHAFSVFHVGTAMTGSVVLGLALASGAIDAERAWQCTLCEELFYERAHDLTRHGLDPIEERRRTGLRRELEAAALYLKATSL